MTSIYARHRRATSAYRTPAASHLTLRREPIAAPVDHESRVRANLTLPGFIASLTGASGLIWATSLYLRSQADAVTPYLVALSLLAVLSGSLAFLAGLLGAGPLTQR